MKKRILILAAIIPIMFSSCLKKDDIQKNEFLNIIAEPEIKITNPPVLYRIPGSPDNPWKTYLFID